MNDNLRRGFLVSATFLASFFFYWLNDEINFMIFYFCFFIGSLALFFLLRPITFIIFLVWFISIIFLNVYSATNQWNEAENKWTEFAMKHHCKIVSKGNGVFGNKTGWLCDDGVTYYK